MKNYSLKIKKILFGVSVGLILTPQAFADVPSNAIPVIIAGLSSDGIALMMKIYGNVIAKMYNQSLQTTADLMYEFDPQLPITIATNQTLANNIKTMNGSLLTASNTKVTYAFQSLTDKANAQRLLSQVPALDDVMPISGGGLFGNMSSAELAERNKQAQANNAMFDAESLIGYDVYNNDQLGNAQKYLAQIGNLVQLPPIITLAPKMDLPIEDPDKPETTMTTVSNVSSSDLDNISKNVLGRNPMYQDYKNKYRAMIAEQNLYMDVIERIYQARVPVVANGGKSVEQIKNDEVNARLDKNYYESMATASPATVSRETLSTMILISKELNDIRKQNEQLLLVNALNGLNKLNTAAATQTEQAKQIGALVYCALSKSTRDASGAINVCKDTTTDNQPAS